ncbi:uncharacterized protein N7518_003593 [Penicillium psychrosexuale]|uniref:uncharacterized protein n=1 Tax=Penicillium psychrosexuale TaxID=1002107 RepID=UPI00254594CF|nr:uncharacterized protein N7518_003593 [Penicillium psychrosexuale]KAJ5801525.1 hypothetical protein N7518_003593 [Penicillium psychrosexuale]
MLISKHSFNFMFYHVVLPPCLPQHDDEDILDDILDADWPLERTLHRFVQEALESFIPKSSPENEEPLNILMTMLRNWEEVDEQGAGCQETLARIISGLKKNRAAALYIKAQNCGWVAYYDKSSDKVIVDAFEVLPRAKDVISAPGSLVRQFPGGSVAIPGSMLGDDRFCMELSRNLARLSTEDVEEMMPKSSKAGKLVPEERDATHPGLVTEGLMTQLLAFGEHNAELSFTKNTREEVNWRSSKLPWRRSPHWLVLRVALQTVLQRALPNGEGYKQYKNFMLYFVAELGCLSTRVRPVVPADCLEIIRAKICRRLLKLKEGACDFVLEHAKSAETIMRSSLQIIQQDIIRSGAMPVPKGIACTPEDLQMSLKSSREYLNSAMSRVPVNIEQSCFDRRHEPRNRINRVGLPILESGDLLSLTDFECWVKNAMETNCYSRDREPSEHSCCLIGDLLQTYSGFAVEAYSDSPDAMSIAIICIMELWVIFDKMCIAICPLLATYSPEVPSNILESLLLPQLSGMQRANKIEAYIHSRHQERAVGAPSIFSDPKSQGFAVSYFDGSEKHQRLRERIEQDAHDSVESKKREWTKKSQQHEELLLEAARTPHQWDVDSRGIEYHSGSCQCCSIESHARNISIDVYEWPLPKREETLKTVIFELDCPHWFLKWRDVTWHLVHDLGRVQIEKGHKMEQNLLSYKETQQFCVSWGQRLTLGSTAKSWKRTHYSSRQFPVAFGDITSLNALRFRLLDTKDNSWVGDQKDHPSLKRWCIFNLPPGPYTCLQYTVDSFLHSENKVIADQQKCPSELSLHEFIAFGCLRAGSRVQWYNMVRELASSSLAMNEEAICMLYRQAAWELSGPTPGSKLREAHVAFAQGGFGSRLLDCLDHKLGCIEANWNEHHTLHTLVVLGLRTLSLSDEFSTVERAKEFLRRSRKIALKWCENLTANLSTQTDAQSEAHQLLIVKIGGLCQLTYAVEPQHLPLLLDNRADLFHLTRSSILVFENSPRSHVNISSGVKNSLIWTAKILHNIEEHTRHLIETDASGFNEAINKSVHDLQIASAWRSCPGDSSRWVINETSADTHGSPQKIHYNLLSGELLLANCPPGRLPREYTSLSLFQRIFGNVRSP